MKHSGRDTDISFYGNKRILERWEKLYINAKQTLSLSKQEIV
jgi:hypothetical protein